LRICSQTFLPSAAPREGTLRHWQARELTTAIMSDFADEATRIVERAQEKDIVMRVMGATVMRKGNAFCSTRVP